MRGLDTFAQNTDYPQEDQNMVQHTFPSFRGLCPGQELRSPEGDLCDEAGKAYYMSELPGESSLWS